MKYEPNNPAHRDRPDIVFAVLSREQVDPLLANGGAASIAAGFAAYHSLEAAEEQACAITRQHVDVYAVAGIVWGIDTAPDPGADHVRWERATTCGSVMAIDRAYLAEEWKAKSYPKGQDHV